MRSTCTIVMAALFSAVFTACSPEVPYRLAIVLDQPGRQGAALAAARINAHGGINGHRLELVNVATPAATGRFAVETAERLAADKSVLAVIGHTNSASSLAASQVYNARHLLQLSPTTTAPMYDRAGSFSYRLVPSDERQGAYLAEQTLALRGTHGPRVAVMYVNNDYGRPLHDVLLARLRDAHIEPAYDGPYAEIDSLSAGEFVGALVRAQPQILVLLGRSADYAPMSRRLRRALPHLVVLASDAFSRGRVLADSTTLFDAVRYVRMVDVDRPDSTLQKLRRLWRSSGRGELNDQAVLGYDAVALLAEGLRATGPSRGGLPVWLSQLGKSRAPFNGLSGPIAFTEKRDRILRYRLEAVVSPPLVLR